MKRIIAFLAFFSIFLFCALPVIAAPYTDEMLRTDSSTTKNYYNLTAMPATGQWAALEDSSFLALANPAQSRGGVIYQVQNAAQVRIRIYSTSGTTVSRNAQGEYLLGNSQLTEGTATALSPKYSPSLDGVFLQADMPYRAHYDRFKGYLFRPVPQMPADLIPYGLTVSSSVDGVNYQVVACSVSRAQFNPTAAMCTEEWVAYLPAKAAYVKVEINDMASVPLVDGTSQAKVAMTMTMLAEVTLEGDKLIVGTPEPIIPESVITSPVSESSASSTKAKENSKANPKTTPQVPAAETSGETTQIETPTSKFEGEIVTSEKPKKTSSSKSSSKSANTTTPQPSSTDTSAESSQASTQEVYYYQQPEAKKDSFTGAVKIYIVIVSAALLFLLLRPKQKNREE